jgi:hypothetical protein
VADGAWQYGSQAAEAEIPRSAEALVGEDETAPTRKIELRQDFVDHGTPEESTRSQLRIDLRPEPLALLRFEIPFVAKNMSAGGDLGTEGLGDIKVRLGLRSIDRPGYAVFPLLDLVFPTAKQEPLGTGKYQLGPGLRVALPVAEPVFAAFADTREIQFQMQLQQFFSVAGESDRKSINYTRLELALETVWRKEYWLNLEPKLTCDWEQNRKIGGILEVEVGKTFSPRWRGWLKSGVGLWGHRVPGTYDTLLQIGARYMF